MGIPSVVFTIPPLASVGLHEEAAKSKGLKFKVNYDDTSKWYSSKRMGESHAGYKVLVEESTNRILGAHLMVQNIVIVIFWFNLYTAGPSIQAIVDAAAPYLFIINLAQTIGLGVMVWINIK